MLTPGRVNARETLGGARLGQEEFMSLAVPMQRGEEEHEKAGCRHVPDSGRRHAGTRRSQRGPRRWLPARRLASPLFRRKDRRDGAFLLGRKTYEIFAGSWPKSTDPADEIATALNTRPKFVASRTLDQVKWSNSILLKGDIAEEVAKLKAQEGGEIQVHGSGNLLQTLLKHDLIDMLRIWQFPVVIGTGKRLFGEGTMPSSFRLVDTQLAITGAVLHVYERAGDLRYGEVEVGHETVIFDSDAAHKWLEKTRRQARDRTQHEGLALRPRPPRAGRVNCNACQLPDGNEMNASSAAPGSRLQRKVRCAARR